jgi:multiple sugar transport system permease protein
MALLESPPTSATKPGKPAKQPKQADPEDALTGTRGTRFSRHLILCLVGLVMLYPLLWLISSSFKPSNDIFRQLGLWPDNWDFSNYAEGWTALNQPFHVYLINSMIVVVFSIIGNIFSCALAAYAFARMEFTGRKLFFALMLGTLMLPGHVLLVPQYIIFSQLGWLDTYLPLIVPNFMATTAIFTFISTWNEFFGPLLYIQNQDLYTVPLALRAFMDSEGQSMWGPMFAMSVVSIAPIIGFFIAGQKYLINGIATTGLK